jgi:hypothetical protein
MIRFLIWLDGLFTSIKSLIWFFLIKKSELILFEISSAELFSLLDIDPVDAVSNAIELASTYDLDTIDKLASTDNFWNNEDWPQEYENLKYVLKLGWLINDIRKNGINNPIQLIQTNNGKYIAHPGTARTLVLAYLLPREKIKVLYVWNKDLDPNPFFAHIPYHTISTASSFLKMFKKSINFKVKAACLNETTECIDGYKYFYFKLAVDSLKKTHEVFSLNFITFIDDSHWLSKIKHKTYFKDIISFSNNRCRLGGINFNKIDNKWIPE